MKRTNRTLKEETRQKISKALKGKPKTEQHKKALAEALKSIGTQFLQLLIIITNKIWTRTNQHL